MHLRRLLLFVTLAAGVAGPARPAAPTDPVLQEATSLAGPVMFLRSGAPGMVLAVVRGDQILIAGYGETQKGNGQEPTADSLFPVNSIAKVFTTEVLADLAAEGTVRLSDALQRYAGNVTVPTSNGRAITLLDLATYTAGLPNLDGAPPGAHPRAWPTHDDRWAWLPGVQLRVTPGTAAIYANPGFDLLADAMEVASGQPYPTLLDRYVTGPLGLHDTGFTPTPEQCARFMVGSGLGGPAACVATGATQGSGGLYSTGHDMALWLRHQMDGDHDPLALSHAAYRTRPALQVAIGFDEAQPMAGLGLGWVCIDAHGSTPALIGKSGAGVGFMSYVAFAPGRDVGVFVVVSSIDVGTFAELIRSAIELIATISRR